MKKRYITLNEEEIKELRLLKKTGGNERERDRSHALLLSHKGHSVEQLSELFEVRRDTILDWFNRWEQDGMDGLSDLPKSGRPPIFDTTEKKK